MAPLTLPKTLTWRPLPAPLAEFSSPTARAEIRTVDTPVPCRRCLRDAQPGEKVVLLSYDPFLGDSPYRGATAIFVHTDDNAACTLADPRADGGGGGGVVPEQQTSRQLAVRAFSRDHMLKAFEVVEGPDIVEASERMLKEGEDVEYLHLYYAAPGCFAVRVDRG